MILHHIIQQWVRNLYHMVKYITLNIHNSIMNVMNLQDSFNNIIIPNNVNIYNRKDMSVDVIKVLHINNFRKHYIIMVVF